MAFIRSFAVHWHGLQPGHGVHLVGWMDGSTLVCTSSVSAAYRLSCVIRLVRTYTTRLIRPALSPARRRLIRPHRQPGSVYGRNRRRFACLLFFELAPWQLLLGWFVCGLCLLIVCTCIVLRYYWQRTADDHHHHHRCSRAM